MRGMHIPPQILVFNPLRWKAARNRYPEQTRNLYHPLDELALEFVDLHPFSQFVPFVFILPIYRQPPLDIMMLRLRFLFLHELEKCLHINDLYGLVIA